jgi:ATP-dependent DNA helicase UvrD/PcrA
VTLDLNPAQRRAVEHGDGPMLVLAGAGSGKTRVLTARIAHLIQVRGVRADRIFSVTFTNKAAGEMRERVAALLGADPRGLWIGTFHSLSARLLRREAPLLGFAPHFTIYDADDTQALLKQMLEQRKLSPKVYPPRALHSLISAAKNRMIDPDEFATAADSPIARVAADCYREMGEVLQRANAFDFDDLLLMPLRLFREHPDRLAWWQRRFDHVLVDEFQDTNAAQYRLVRHLARGHGNLCVVGDDDQAIYGWRGADVRHMLAFQDDFQGAALIKLEQNYRSTQIILDAANGVIAENRDRLGKTLFTAVQGGSAVVRLEAADERDEAEWLAGELSGLTAREDVPYEAMAVLYRTNSQSRALEEALRMRGVPYRLVGAVSFYERREVKDLLAYLRLIANPADDQAFARIVNAPRRGIGDVSVGVLAETARRWKVPFLETARRAGGIEGLRPGLRDGFSRFAELIHRLRAAAGQGDPATALEMIVASTGYEAWLADEGLEGVERLDNVRELIAGAAAWAEVADATGEDEPQGSMIERYLTQSALVTPTDEFGGANAAGVTLLTVHMAKGLEWPVVAVAGLEDGLFPLARTAGEPGGLEEERRLCYVALTRARERLYLSWARTRYRNGRLEMSAPSRFLDAVPQSVVEERSTTPSWTRAGSYPGSGGGSGRARWRRVEEPEPVFEDDEASQDRPRLIKGERVRHRKFGGGVVREISGVGRGLKVTVEFDDTEVGTKQLLVAYAALERDWDGDSP